MFHPGTIVYQINIVWITFQLCILVYHTDARMWEWLLFNTTWEFFTLYHGENKLHFEEMMMMYTLY